MGVPGVTLSLARLTEGRFLHYFHIFDENGRSGSHTTKQNTKPLIDSVFIVLKFMIPEHK
jgi:hypothetical protein